jgi:hypothetical protein
VDWFAVVAETVAERNRLVHDPAAVPRFTLVAAIHGELAELMLAGCGFGPRRPGISGVGDRELLAGMRCSTGAWFEDEVETFIQARLADYHDWRQPRTDHAIVGLELADNGLIAIGSHEAEFVRDSGELVTSTYLECAAVSTKLQGALLPEVEPLDEMAGR